MTLEQLRVLATITKTGSFQAAAKILKKSRPAISIAIKNLEEELDLELFSRDKYRPKLTSAGKLFCVNAESILNNIHNLYTLAEQLNQGHEPEISIAVDTLCPLPALMTTIHLFQADYPTTRINLSVENGKSTIEKLISGTAHLAITEFGRWDPKLKSFQWITVDFMPVATPSFSLAKNRDEITYQELINHVQITVKDSEQSFLPPEKHIEEGRANWVVGDFHVKKQILLSALGWGFMPKYLIENELEAGTLVPLNLAGITEMKIALFLVRRNDIAIGPVAQKIWDFFK